MTTSATVTLTGSDGGVTYFGGVRLDFGDGHIAIFCNPGSSCGKKSMAHTYAAGVYKAQLFGLGEGGRTVLGEVSINAQ